MKRYTDDFKASIIKMHTEKKENQRFKEELEILKAAAVLLGKR